MFQAGAPQEGGNPPIEVIAPSSGERVHDSEMAEADAPQLERPAIEVIAHIHMPARRILKGERSLSDGASHDDLVELFKRCEANNCIQHRKAGNEAIKFYRDQLQGTDMNGLKKVAQNWDPKL